MNGRRQIFPRGWRDFVLQLGIWVGFGLAYQLARGFADRDPHEAMVNGRLVIDVERGLHTLIEPDLQRVVVQNDLFLDAFNWTYWLSQFPVIGLALLWIYLFRNEAFLRVRNWVLMTNLLGLIGYVVMPTAPPRMFPEEGFIDTLASSAALNHGSGLVQLASNQYAAMPSLHAADSLLVGVTMALIVRRPVFKLLWLAWPVWVWFCVIATANHFWLDIVAGVAVAVVAAALVYRRELRAAVARRT